MVIVVEAGRESGTAKATLTSGAGFPYVSERDAVDPSRDVVDPIPNTPRSWSGYAGIVGLGVSTQYSPPHSSGIQKLSEAVFVNDAIVPSPRRAKERHIVHW